MALNIPRQWTRQSPNLLNPQRIQPGLAPLLACAASGTGLSETHEQTRRRWEETRRKELSLAETLGFSFAAIEPLHSSSSMATPSPNVANEWGQTNGNGIQGI
jgi:hypothetical protein